MLSMFRKDGETWGTQLIAGRKAKSHLGDRGATLRWAGEDTGPYASLNRR
jgi:hypothetical protein